MIPRSVVVHAEDKIREDPAGCYREETQDLSKDTSAWVRKGNCCSMELGFSSGSV